MAEVQLVSLVICRIFSFMVTAPILSQRSFPNTAKLIVGGSLVVAAIPLVGKVKAMSVVIFALAALKETLLGLAMGYVSQLVFQAVIMAGSLIDFQNGFSMGRAYDRTMEVSSSQFGRMYYWLALAVFFMLNLHLELFRAVMLSFTIVPLGTATLTNASVKGVVILTSKTLAMAFNVAAPLIIAVMVIDIVLGILSRSVPQMNVLMLSLSLKSTVGMIIFLIMLPNVVELLGKIIPQSYEYLVEFLRSVGQA
ncbi:flagellar biosynthetic protein FliR [Latilactobacillus curvatus]|uniref:flagellar biosynthetic protein FliR n=1 Tax=Latilactobacillus curvatus TaxID=28038 RepID=UPI002410A144|nr:flagellar biosynthetic protein FliR [Latilactobacillus curvatus]MDG2977891.1 flagellar biosynthetic protein FliR [Latilactobacillus curvatus]